MQFRNFNTLRAIAVPRDRSRTSYRAKIHQKLLISEEPKRTINEVNSTPVQTEPEVTVTDTNCFTSTLALICGTLFKGDVNETVPAPTETGQLNSMLTELKVEGFSKDVCRSMVSMLDEDKSGKLGYTEFKLLWESIRQWKNVWLMYDTDKSGTFSGFELRDALNSAGYKLNSKILNVLMHRYGNRSGELDFEDFMSCSIKLKTMLDVFKSKDPDEKNTAQFTLEEWLETTLYS